VSSDNPMGQLQRYRLGAPLENNQPAMRRVDTRTLEQIRYTSDRSIHTTRYTISEDGRQLTESNAGKAADGTALAISSTYHRVGGSPLSGHEGTWEHDAGSTRSNEGIFARFKAIPDGIDVEAGSVSYAAKLDGTEAPFKNGATGTVAVQRSNANTILVMRKHPNGLRISEKWEVSEDGHTLMVSSVWERQGVKITSTSFYVRQ